VLRLTSSPKGNIEAILLHALLILDVRPKTLLGPFWAGCQEILKGVLKKEGGISFPEFPKFKEEEKKLLF